MLLAKNIIMVLRATESENFYRERVSLETLEFPDILSNLAEYAVSGEGGQFAVEIQEEIVAGLPCLPQERVAKEMAACLAPSFAEGLSFLVEKAWSFGMFFCCL